MKKRDNVFNDCLAMKMNHELKAFIIKSNRSKLTFTFGIGILNWHPCITCCLSTYSNMTIICVFSHINWMSWAAYQKPILNLNRLKEQDELTQTENHFCCNTFSEWFAQCFSTKVLNTK